ncbi:hypothetical protein G6F32_015261 [Rhizopus arrhizus]|nr:hypothetical protein G6F32_015261 [Rhizopus arrhizus]
MPPRPTSACRRGSARRAGRSACGGRNGWSRACAPVRAGDPATPATGRPPAGRRSRPVRPGSPASAPAVRCHRSPSDRPAARSRSALRAAARRSPSATRTRRS